MDPFSIATGSASLVVLCVQVSATLYTWIDDTRQVDTNVAALCEEILALSRVLDAISKTWKRNPQITSVHSDPDGTLWVSVKASIDDCKATLEKMSRMVDDVQKGGAFGRGFIRRTTKQIKFTLKAKDISVYKQRVQSYNSAMQSALHMINLCLLLQSNSSQESVSRILSDLKSQIGRVEEALISREDILVSRDDIEENERISRNLHQFVRAAESFHSSASTVASDRSTVWGGSILGDPLTQDQMSSIENWIPPPSIVEEDEQNEEIASSTGRSAPVSNNRSSIMDMDITSVHEDLHDSDSDSDIEKDLTRKFQELAVAKLEERDYEKAEQFFQKVLDRSATEEESPQNLTVVKVKLAYAYCFQGRWEEAEAIIVPIAMGKQKVDISAFHGLHTLALLHYGKNGLETAEKYCKRALMGKKKILGKDHASYFESINLLSRIYLAKGDQAESEVYRSFLPAGHNNELPNSPLDYLYRATANKKSAVPKEAPLLVTPPIESPPPLLTSSPHSELSSAFNPPPERQRGWRGIFGVSSNGLRTPDLYKGQKHQQLMTQNNYQQDTNADYQRQPATNTQTYAPSPQYFPLREASIQSSIPDSRPTPSISRSYLLVGVDFGTFDSAVAFTVARNTSAREDLITDWPGAGNKVLQRTPSVLYYENNQKVVGWGANILDALAPTGYSKPGVQKFEWFKLQLPVKDGQSDHYVDTINLPPLPSGKGGVDVVADYLSKLREATRLSLIKILGEFFNREELNILYYFTIPAFFNEAAKMAFKNAIIQAGYLQDWNDDRVTFVEEPKALVMYCSKIGLLNLKKYDTILIVDGGGGTVDLNTYEVEESDPFTLHEITPASGDSCGHTALNRNFSNILRAKIRKAKIPDGSRTAGKIYAKCMIDFEQRIKHDFRNNGQKWEVNIGVKVAFPEADIEDDYMAFNNSEILDCFEPVVSRIIELVRSQIIATQTKNKELQNILVAGTFGRNEYLFQQIKLHLPPPFQSKVVRPMDCESALVKGAVTHGIASKFGTSKISKRHYLVDVLQPFQVGRHPDYYCINWPDGRLFCKYTYQKFLAKAERIIFGEPRKLSIEKFVAPGESLIFEDKIYTCDDDDCPTFVVDAKISPTGTCITDLSAKFPEVDFQKFQNSNGTFYLVKYDLYFTADMSKLIAETVFSGEVVGRCSISFEQGPRPA